ncbi:MAG: DUF1592 domain-containing protein [Verrucomicrobiales bacterium]
MNAELAAGETFRDAVKAGMLAILCSKSFLFLAEGDEDSDRFTLNDYEIASRLSYLLWSTMPDTELTTLAGQGKLRDKAELGRQLTRLLADPRADRFTDSFATQWLRLRKVGMFQPDKKLYPDYDKTLEASMIGETKAFFRQVLQDGPRCGNSSTRTGAWSTHGSRSFTACRSRVSPVRAFSGSPCPGTAIGAAFSPRPRSCP